MALDCPMFCAGGRVSVAQLSLSSDSRRLIHHRDLVLVYPKIDGHSGSSDSVTPITCQPPATVFKMTGPCLANQDETSDDLSRSRALMSRIQTE